MSSHEELRSIALAEFAQAGYSATSLQRIAEIAGLSKSSVLYHYASKEALLEAAVAPAVDAMEIIIASMEGLPLDQDRRRSFIVEFVDFLLSHRNEVHIFVNQSATLEDVPIIDRANQIVVRLATFFATAVNNTEDRMRFGIALGGAAYMLGTQRAFDSEPTPIEEMRPALVTVLSELLAPIAVPTPAQ